MSDLLDPAVLLSSLPNLLPPSSKKLNSPHDGIAALLHTIMSAVGFRLIAVDDAGPARSVLENVLPDEWNKHGPGNYTFRYKHEQSSLEFVLKVAKLGGRTLVNAIAVESEKAASLDISTQDFVSTSFYPHDLSASAAPPLVHGFISSNRIADLASRFKLSIIQQLVPGLRKEGYTEDVGSASGSRPATTPGSSDRQPPRPRPATPPYAPEPLPNQLPPYMTPANPLQIGRSDLEPFGSRGDPFRPPPLFPDNGDGMIVGPNHPMFATRRVRDDYGSGIGPWGGDGFVPPPPPGARFDQIFPAGAAPAPGPRDLRRSPNNDEFMPPGMGGGGGGMFM